MPAVVASPNAWLSRSRCSLRQPPWTRMVEREQVDACPRMGDEVNHEAVVAERVTGHSVPATADRGGQLAIAGEPHRRDHIGHARTTGDERRAAIDPSVPDRSGLVVRRVIRRQQFA